MSSSISSAEWPKLYRYSDRALQIDRELAGEGSRIAGVLRNFEASCTEYRVAVSHLAGEIQGYASRAEGTDVWVRQVGVEFQRADRSAEILRISPYVELKRIQDWNDKLQWWYDQLLFPIGAMAIIRFSLLEGIKNPNIVRISLAWLRPVANFFGEDVWWLRGKVGIDHWTAATPGPLVWHFVSFLAVKDLLQTLPVVIEQATRDIFGPDGLPRKIGKVIGDVFVPIAPILAAWIVGAKFGALAGTAVAPGLGTLGGAIIGVIVGTLLYIGVKWGVGELFENIHLREKITTWTEVGVRVINTGLEKGTQAVDKLLRPVVTQVSQKVQSTANIIATRFASSWSNLGTKIHQLDQILRPTVKEAARSTFRVISSPITLPRQFGLSVVSFVNEPAKIDRLLAPVVQAISRFQSSARNAIDRFLSEVVGKTSARFIWPVLQMAPAFGLGVRSGGNVGSPSPSPHTELKPPNADIALSEQKTRTDRIYTVINQLLVENAKDYRRDRQGKGETYCNIFVMDFAKNMGIPLPQRLDWNQDNRFDDDLDANEAIAWLNGTYGHDVQTGPQLGWLALDAAKAVEMAKAGFVVVAGWQNPGGIGHMALVRPDSTGVNDIRIAQAGGSNFTSGSLADGFGSREPIQYFVYHAPRDGSTKI